MGAGREGICNTKYVAVDEKQAAWIFAEFQTDRTLSDLEAWLEPSDWPRWGPGMFKSMDLLGEKSTVPGTDGEAWEAKYMEVVSLAGQELRTVLQCDVKKTTRWAAMTYDLDHSVKDVLNVDRGFLAAIDLGNGKRLVKALKVVGFTNTVNDILATAVCPAWTEWMYQATQTAADKAQASAHGDTHGPLGDGGNGDGAGDASAGEAASGFSSGYAEQWADCVSEMAHFYGAYATDVSGRLWSGGYGTRDASEDTSRLFLRLARDWSRAWRAGADVAQGLAGAEVPPTGGVPSGAGIWKRSLEYATVPVPAPDKPASVEVTDLSRIGVTKAIISATVIKLDPLRIAAKAADEDAGKRVGIRVLADTTSVAPGLYQGDLIVRPDSGEPLRFPVLFYASKARPLKVGD